MVIIRKIIIIVQNVSVIVMNDAERHLEEYRKYEIELNKNIETENNPQQLYWFKNRLKSVTNRIRDVEYEVKNG